MDTNTTNPAATRIPRVALQCADDTDTMVDASIKAIILPMDILQQLRGMNIVPSFLNAGEIEDMIQACKFDSTLADDPNGIGFRDQLSLTPLEKKNGRGRQHALPAWYYMEKDCEEQLAM